MLLTRPSPACVATADHVLPTPDRLGKRPRKPMHDSTSALHGFRFLFLFVFRSLPPRPTLMPSPSWKAAM